MGRHGRKPCGMWKEEDNWSSSEAENQDAPRRRRARNLALASLTAGLAGDLIAGAGLYADSLKYSVLPAFALGALAVILACKSNSQGTRGASREIADAGLLFGALAFFASGGLALMLGVWPK